MADWTKITQRGNVSDRRGSPLALGGGIGIVGIGLTLLVTYLSGGDVLGTFLNMAAQQGLPASVEDASQFEGEDPYEQFAATVLGSTDAYWTEQFADMGRTYALPELVLFRGGTQSACGGASSLSGPHYCPVDSKIYLDETFFDELQTRLGAQGGDVAEAYVIAHEVGHHVQNELGLLAVNGSNNTSIATELQADCFAGAWLGSLKEEAVLEAGEIREALDAASSVGDDHIQRRTQGQIHPETWTHGSSEERVASFTQGYQSGSMESCTQ